MTTDREPADRMWRESLAAFNGDGGVSIAERMSAGWCHYTDHDLFTNRRLRCERQAGHEGAHRLVWGDE